ncbi:hypothetical protein JCM11641_002805 [Rhodosporidiobolus odoratus]
MTSSPTSFYPPGLALPHTPLLKLSLSRKDSPSTAFLAVPSNNGKNNVMSTTPRSSSQLHIAQYVHQSGGSTTSTSPDASVGSDSEDDEGEIPLTPGDDRFSPLRHEIKVAAPTPVRTAVKGIELSKFFDTEGLDPKDLEPLEAEDEGKGSRTTDQLLSANAESFFPSFGDYLPSVKQEERQRQVELQGHGVGLGLFGAITSQQDRHVERVTRRTRGLTLQRGDGKEQEEIPFSPDTVDDSFTFFPSPKFTSENGSGSYASTKPTSNNTASSLFPPKVGHPVLYLPPSISSSVSQLPGFPATPPRTPVRTSFSQQQQQSGQYPVSLPRVSTANLAAHTAAVVNGYFAESPSVPVATATSVSLPPTPTSLTIPLSTSPYYSTTPPAALSTSPAPVAVPIPVSSSELQAAYPLSPADTDRIAKLHNGRIPTMQQLSPPEVLPGIGQQPIVNTGNQGPMVVQAGDWRCGVCAFVNWRRRKICLRCFPYANDIGNILTIQSQRAAHLAAPGSTTPSRSTFAVAPAVAASPAQCTSLCCSPVRPTFHVQAALPSYTTASAAYASARFGSNGNNVEGIPSAQVAAAAMARSSTYPPPPRSVSYPVLENQGSLYRASTSGSGSAGMGRAYSTPTPLPSPRYGSFPASVPTVGGAYFTKVAQQQQAPLPPVIWNDDPSFASSSQNRPHHQQQQRHNLSHFSSSNSSSKNSGSGGTFSAGSAGEHAAMLAARATQALKVKEGGECGFYPALAPVSAGKRHGGYRGGGEDGGWAAAARTGYLAPPGSLAQSRGARGGLKAVGCGQAEL